MWPWASPFPSLGFSFHLCLKGCVKPTLGVIFSFSVCPWSLPPVKRRRQGRYSKWSPVALLSFLPPYTFLMPAPPPHMRLWERRPCGGQVSPPPPMAHPCQPQAIMGWGPCQPRTRGSSGDSHSGCWLCWKAQNHRQLEETAPARMMEWV